MAAGDTEANITTPVAQTGARFDGVDDSIDLGVGNVLGVTSLTSPFSIGLWINKSDAAGTINVFSSSRGANDRFGITISNIVRVGTYNGAIYNNKHSSTNITAGKWHRVLVVFDGTTMALYLDGILQSGTTQPAVGNDDMTVIGADVDPLDKNWNGPISDVHFWNRGLTQEEATEYYSGKIVSGISHRWRLDTDYTDSIGDVDGTNSGTYLGIIDDETAAAIKADRTTANDSYMMVGIKGQIISTVIEEAP